MPSENTSHPSKTVADVIMYCTPWCPSCRAARQFLKERGISFQEVDIGKDRKAAAQVREWAGGNETTPTFDIHGQIVVDWDKWRVMELLGID